MLRTILSIHSITNQPSMCSSIQIQRIQENPKSNHHTTTTIRRVPPSVYLPEHIHHHHIHTMALNQCSSTIIQTISAPVETVWSVVRRFDEPHTYKHFLKSCDVIVGDGDVGSVREVRVVSGLPAGSSLERLEIRDDERYVMSFSVVGGDHRLKNYRSVTTLHSSPTCRGTTVVVESYVVDVPPENTKTLVRCNLMSLKHIAQTLAHK